MGIKIKKSICINCSKDFEYNSYVSYGKYCSNKCQAIYQRQQKIDNGTAGWGAIKSYLKSMSNGECVICETSEWLKKPIMLITDHIDGNANNNSLDNLRLICSNCDATLPTYKSKNNGKGRGSLKKYAAEALK